MFLLILLCALTKHWPVNTYLKSSQPFRSTPLETWLHVFHPALSYPHTILDSVSSALFCSPLWWMVSGKCWVWRDFLAHWGREEFSHPKEGCLLLFLTPFWIIEGNPLLLNISLFNTGQVKKKGLKSRPLAKAPFSRHMDKLHPGYLPINLWFLWEIARHVMYSRYKTHNFGPSTRSVNCETLQLLLDAFN